MMPKSSLDERFSVLTLAVAADSGWYTANFQHADSYNWGKNKGCSFFGGKCWDNPNSEYCEFPGVTGCSDDFEYVTKCEKAGLTRPCFVSSKHHSCKRPRPSRVKSFLYGRSSICHSCRVIFPSRHNLQKKNGKSFGECFAIKCNEQGTRYKVYTHSGRKKIRFVCDKKGKKSEGILYNFDFFCHDPATVCKPKTVCPLDCRHRYCLARFESGN